MKSKSQECRKHARHRLACPVTLFGPREDFAVTTGIGNLSEGGVYVRVPASQAPSLASKVSLSFCVARKSGIPDVFAIEAKVLRHEPTRDQKVCGVAMQFHEPLPLQ